MEKLFISSDHAAFEEKEMLKKYLESNNIEVEDVGTYSNERCNYPDFAVALCKKVLSSEIKGILLCGSGIGVSMTANRFSGIRAALCHNEYSAKMGREHNDANVICLGERVSGFGMVEAIVDAWNDSSFQGGRHEGRVDKINALSKMGSCRV